MKGLVCAHVVGLVEKWPNGEGDPEVSSRSGRLEVSMHELDIDPRLGRDASAHGQDARLVILVDAAFDRCHKAQPANRLLCYRGANGRSARGVRILHDLRREEWHDEGQRDKQCGADLKPGPSAEAHHFVGRRRRPGGRGNSP